MLRDWRKRKKPLPRRRRSSISLKRLKEGFDKIKWMSFTRIDYRVFQWNRRKSHVRMDYTGSISDIDNRK